MRMASVIVLLLLTIHASSHAQTQDSIPTATQVPPQDSARIVNSVSLIRAKHVDTTSMIYRPTKLPGVALLLSAVLPGAGQFYNESYWKIPIVLGFGYYFATQWINNNDSTKHYRDLYAQSFTQTQGGNSNFQRLREFYKDQRDAFSWYFFIYYMLNLVDAYVDASLYDFNVGDDLSIHLRPEFEVRPYQNARLNIKINF